MSRFQIWRLQRKERRLARLEGEYRELGKHDALFAISPHYMMEMVSLAGRIEKTKTHIEQLKKQTA